MLSKKWQLKNNKYLVSSGGLSLAKTSDHGFRVSSDKFRDTVDIVSHWQDPFLSLFVVRTFAQSWKNSFEINVLFSTHQFSKPCQYLLRQSPFSFVCLQFQWMDLNLLLICRTHFLLTLLTESILIHSFLPDHCAKYFFLWCKARTHCLLPN